MNHIIIGLDRADKQQYLNAKKYFSILKTKHSILWNDGPNLKKLQSILHSVGIADVEDGKGKNVWYCIGYAISRNTAAAIAFHDWDIKTYNENILIKLFYPLINRSMGYSFSKGYYPRYSDNKLNGRVTRLLVTPLVKSLIMLFGRRLAWLLFFFLLIKSLIQNFVEKLIVLFCRNFDFLFSILINRIWYSPPGHVQFAHN